MPPPLLPCTSIHYFTAVVNSASSIRARLLLVPTTLLRSRLDYFFFVAASDPDLTSSLDLLRTAVDAVENRTFLTWEKYLHIFFGLRETKTTIACSKRHQRRNELKDGDDMTKRDT